MKNLFLASTLLLVSILSFSQYTPPSIQWQRCLGGTRGEICEVTQMTNDRGFILAGSTNSNDGNVSGNHDTTGSSRDAWVVKLDSLGAIQWQRCYGGSDDDFATAITQTNDHGYFFGGTSLSFDGDCAGNPGGGPFYYEWVVKLDSIGNIQWQRVIGGDNDDIVYFLQQTNDGGYIVAGNVNHGYDINICKLSSSGLVQWSYAYGGSDRDIVNSIQQTSEGGYIFAGSTASLDGNVSGSHDLYNGIGDYWVVKLNSSGHIEWQKCLGGTGFECSTSIHQTNSGGYIVSGSSTSNDCDVTRNHGSRDYWIVKLDSAGNIIWQRSLGGSLMDGAGISVGLDLTIDSGYIVIGGSCSNDGDVTGHHGTSSNYDYWVVKLDSTGTIQWEKSLGGLGNEGNGGARKIIQQTPDGGYFIGGNSNSGNSGDVLGGHGGYDFWVVKLGPAVLSVNEQKDEEKQLIVYPNPSSGQFNVRLPQKTSCIELFNSLGQVVEQRDVKGTDLESFEVGKAGVYMVRVTTERQVLCKELIIDN